MARDTESIEREIEMARNQLANTLDELSVRANPRRIAEDTKQTLVAKVNEPRIKMGLIGAGAALVLLILIRLFR
ncbi:DUF3618 domain-containing protein [Skermania piniformis]|uniref:DUF3618 domain-containing protein n=1 Tax=Skermania pinensis TaxID=39122 RepID=A0ABX8SAF5_9ACTN|nr:DUF3618 domain-containing protein [Skermania piniformis]QXQ14797.1 DUF3618 domain-containing protein [Skermania piniformis]